MKIGIVLSQPPRYSETFLNLKIKGLQMSGHNVTLFVQKKDDSFNLCKTITAPRVFKRSKLLQLVLGFKCGLLLLTVLKKVLFFIKLERRDNKKWYQIIKNTYNNSHILKADLDWLHFEFVALAVESENVSKAIKVKMAVSCRGYDMDVFPIKHKDVYKNIWDKVDKVHCISKYMLMKAIETGKKEKTPYQIITPAIDIKKFAPNKKASNSVIQITTIARLHWIKGLNETLEALNILKKHLVDFKYTIIGSGDQLEEIKFAIHQLKLNENVEIINVLDPFEIIKKLNETTIYVQYSISEGFCNAVLEAQAMGCLCVVSDGGALPENILHKQTGWVVPKRNPKALAEMIMYVIQLPDHKKQNIRSNAKSRVIQNFNLKKQQKEFLKFYE